jgi:DNA-binding GntR family transcriptional regulator
LAASERNAAMHRRILEIAAHRVANDICARLNSQMVRFQFRTVLAPGRPGKSVAEHRRIVSAIAGRDRDGAQRAMLEHLTNVAATLEEMAAPARVAI